MNLPNKLSVFRILIVPFMVIIPLFIHSQIKIFGVDLEIHILNALFIIASITDYLDGEIARKYNLITDFGKFIDPLADKVVVLGALMVMVELNIISSIIPIIIIIREFAVSGYRLVAAGTGKVVAASFMGKVKTASQMVAIVLLLLAPYKMGDIFNFAYGTNISHVINLLGHALLIFSVIATIISGYDYLKDMKTVLKEA